MEREDARSAALAALKASVPEAEHVVERMEPRIRQLEELPALEDRILHGTKSETIYEMNGLSFNYEAIGGQKTGAFLDQRENYAAAARVGFGDALDICTYQGGFALHLAATKSVPHQIPSWYQSLLCCLVAVALSSATSMFDPKLKSS